MDSEAIASLKELFTRFGEAFPETVPTLVLAKDTLAGDTLAIGIMDGEEQMWLGLPDELLALPALEVVAQVVLENEVRRGRKLDITFYPPTLAQVEWTCTVCGVTRLDCKCEGGPSRFSKASGDAPCTCSETFPAGEKTSLANPDCPWHGHLSTT